MCFKVPKSTKPLHNTIKNDKFTYFSLLKPYNSIMWGTDSDLLFWESKVIQTWNCLLCYVTLMHWNDKHLNFILWKNIYVCTPLFGKQMFYSYDVLESYRNHKDQLWQFCKLQSPFIVIWIKKANKNKICFNIPWKNPTLCLVWCVEQFIQIDSINNIQFL